MKPVQTPFYTCGFLYSLKTHQILLLQSDQQLDSPSPWSMMGGESIEGEEAEAAFQRIMNKKLNISLNPKDIYPIYDYFHNTSKKLNYVFYAEIKNTKAFENLKKNLSWFTFGETLKLLLTSQSKQDILIGERVVNAKSRDIEAKKLLQIAS